MRITMSASSMYFCGLYNSVLYLFLITCIFGSSLDTLHLWLIILVIDYTCDWLYLWLIILVIDYTCDGLYLWLIITCDGLYFIITCDWLYLQLIILVIDYAFFFIWRLYVCLCMILRVFVAWSCILAFCTWCMIHKLQTASVSSCTNGIWWPISLPTPSSRRDITATNSKNSNYIRSCS